MKGLTCGLKMLKQHSVTARHWASFINSPSFIGTREVMSGSAHLPRVAEGVGAAAELEEVPSLQERSDSDQG